MVHSCTVLLFELDKIIMYVPNYYSTLIADILIKCIIMILIKKNNDNIKIKK